MKSTKMFGLVAALLPLLGAATACDDDDDDDIVEPGTAEIRVVHASPDAPAVDVYAAGIGDPLVADLAYGDASEYLVVDPGSYDFEIRPAGAAADSAPVFSTGALAVADGDRITAVAAGLLGGSGGSAFRVLPLAEGFDPAPADSAIVRIVHASADAPAVAIDVGNDGAPELEDVARYADSGPTGIALPAGEPLAIGIWAGEPLGRVTAFTTPELPAGAELFVIATGLLGELPRDADGFALLAIGPDGPVGFIAQDPVVYALHASPNAPAVDIYAGDARLVEGAAFGGLSGAIQVQPGAYTLDFYATGTGPGTPAASAQTPALDAGERYLAIASGFLGGDPAFRLIPVTDALASDDGANARLGVIHASPDAPSVDVSTVTGAVMDSPSLVGDLAFPEIAGDAGLSIPPGSYTLGVAAAGSTDPVATFDVALTAGLRAHAVAAGALSPETGDESFRLLVVDTSAWPWTVVEVLPNE